MGWLRNLTAAEIVAQRLTARKILHQQQAPPPGPFLYDSDGIHNLVFMGMGEPLDNYDAVLQAMRVLSDPRGLAFPRSQITLSTVGRIDGLQRLAGLVRGEPQWGNLRLAISLHAADDRLRDQLVPINRGMPLAELQRALIDYPMPRRGLFLIQYVLLGGVNDSLADADAVARWCAPLRCVVNLIPYNPQRDAEFSTPPDDRIQAFLHRLRERGIFVKRRVTQGRDLMGACGQLGNPQLRRTQMSRAKAPSPQAST
jgi:23S rRNA (adenine2503-C2)-methyltransferase